MVGVTSPQPALYSGVHFRSTLEARWALFFDTIGRSWDYEVAEFPVCEGHSYLPALYVHGLGWVEVKGPPFLSAASMAKIAAGAAGPRPLPSREHPYTPPGAVIILGDVPRVERGIRPVHSIVLAETTTPGRAEVWHVVLGPRGVPELIGQRPVRTIDASGVIPREGPPMELRRTLCNPEPVRGAVPRDVARAYAAADSLRVTSLRNRTSPVTAHGCWAGRPLHP